jgi:heme-degrading monooxygenase HmoA
VIRVVYRAKIADLGEEALARSWRQAMSAICKRAKGALGGMLLRTTTEPCEYVIVTRWESVEAWRDFWSQGPPEPQGDPTRNEMLVEVDGFESADVPAAFSTRGGPPSGRLTPARRG